jgi:hypothetical protein
MSLSNYAENKLLDHLLGKASYTMPTTTYFKLHLGDPGEDGSANAAANTTRQAASWNVASTGTSTLASDITWTSVPNTETIAWVSLWDASSGGNCLAIFQLSSSAALTAGDNFTLTASGTSVSMD